MNQQLSGLSILGFQRGVAGGKDFAPSNPATGEALQPAYHSASEAEIAHACELAGRAFHAYRRLPHGRRAEFLHAIAHNLEAMADSLMGRFMAESGLPAGRAAGELGRTCAQLRLFAAEIEKSGWNRPVIEHANPDRKPLPKPDTRLRYVPVGPVAVFGPANFPLAFAVAGGDSASALAAGCTVVVKAHSSHPGTSELAGLAVLEAAKSTGMPDGVFSLVFGSGRSVGAALVKHPAIQAVGFTGSEAVGRALFDLAAARPSPIPVFAEMSSINPVLMLHGALSADPERLAEGLYGSLTLGVGQFCTNPGLILLPDINEAVRFTDALRRHLAAHPAQTMLNKGTAESYCEGLTRLSSAKGVETLLPAKSLSGPGSCDAAPALFKVSSDDFISQDTLHEEVFGPTTLIVSCKDSEAMATVIKALGGQLAISVHGTTSDAAADAELIALLETRCGRIVFNGFPTGVEVCESMVHGGPYPATTDGRFTSVGARAIDRFLRPVCYQGFPQTALPEELRD